MPEDDRAPAGGRATWVALRTIRQRPTVVGRTPDGETVYEIRSVRLLLPDGSPHFRRLVQCAKCGREIGGAPVLSADDLDRHPNLVFCGRCVVPRPPVAEAPPVDTGPAEPTGAGDDPQLAALAATVAEARAELLRLAGAQKAMSETLADVRAEMQELARGRAEAVATPPAVHLDEAIERRLDALTAAADAGASRDHALEQKLNECIDRIRVLAEEHSREAARRPAPGALLESLEHQLRAAEERLGQR